MSTIDIKELVDHNNKCKSTYKESKQLLKRNSFVNGLFTIKNNM